VEVEVCVQHQIDQLSSQDRHLADTSPQIWQDWFTIWLESLHPHIPTAPSYELGMVFTNDQEIQILNNNYRQQNKPTDVLAFAALEVECPQSEEMLTSMPLYLGDIIISVDTAQRQAEQQGHNLLTELAWLATHGLLHLLGWDHPDEETLQIMCRQQVILLKNSGITIDLV
jgi:probable rRNA maturation factor